MIWRILSGRRFWAYFVAPQVLFFIAAVATKATVLLPIFSFITFALSAGICVAFCPSVITIFEERGPLDRAAALALGIFCTWFATSLLGLWGLAWRIEGQPLWMVNNDIVSYMRFLNICGAALHLAAPGAITERIPPARWVKIGVLVTIAIVVFTAIGYALNFFAEPPSRF